MQPPITQVTIPGSNYENGRAKAIDQITFHHIVGDAAAAIARFKNPGEQVSSTYVIGSDGKIYQCVAEGNTPYTDANFDSNSRAITIEHAGPPYAEAMYTASAQLCAWIMSRYNITRFMRHRDVSQKPTACPGTLDVERIIQLAKGGNMPTIVTDDLTNLVYAAVLHDTPKVKEAYDHFRGMPLEKMIDEVYHSDRYKQIQAALDAPPAAPPGTVVGSFTDADRTTANETNNIVKQILNKIISIFK